jgi:hypothetical protein
MVIYHPKPPKKEAGIYHSIEQIIKLIQSESHANWRLTA